MLDMPTVAISQFKAQCIAALKRVNETGTPLTVTIRGKPIAVVQKPAPVPQVTRLGGMKGTGQILGEIVKVDFADDWESIT
jgi:prevent-host-death family protein